jgi:arginine repressor
VKTKRHAKILEIVHSTPVDTQDELLRLLRESGFEVTQATVSRDIKELRLIKTLDNNGRYRYSTVRQENEHISSKFHSLFCDAVTGIDYAGNIVVIKCLVGMAQAACAAMDSLHWNHVIGTVAGDDTILCITKSEAQSVELTAELKKLLRDAP